MDVWLQTKVLLITNWRFVTCQEPSGGGKARGIHAISEQIRQETSFCHDFSMSICGVWAPLTTGQQLRLISKDQS